MRNSLFYLNLFIYLSVFALAFEIEDFDEYDKIKGTLIFPQLKSINFIF